MNDTSYDLNTNVKFNEMYVLLNLFHAMSDELKF